MGVRLSVASLPHELFEKHVGFLLYQNRNSFYNFLGRGMPSGISMPRLPFGGQGYSLPKAQGGMRCNGSALTNFWFLRGILKRKICPTESGPSNRHIRVAELTATPNITPICRVWYAMLKRKIVTSCPRQSRKRRNKIWGRFSAKLDPPISYNWNLSWTMYGLRENSVTRGNSWNRKSLAAAFKDCSFLV